MSIDFNKTEPVADLEMCECLHCTFRSMLAVWEHLYPKHAPRDDVDRAETVTIAASRLIMEFIMKAPKEQRKRLIHEIGLTVMLEYQERTGAHAMPKSVN
jgi:hypothetical protein